MIRKKTEDWLCRTGLRWMQRKGFKQIQRDALRDGKVFYCKALAGESNYNICINSDLTVSCNCQDYTGEGHIGDLKTQGLSQIFRGEKAALFRRSLSEGKLPISKCGSCRELTRIDRDEAESRIENYTLPTPGIQVENTVLCNLDCIGCRIDWKKFRSRMTMSTDDMRLAADTVRECGIEHVALINQGEPFLAKDVVEHIGTLKDRNPNITMKTHTNGILLNSPEKMEAALLLNAVGFSLHGTDQQSAERYQRKVNFDAAFTNMKNLVAMRDERGSAAPEISWKYLTFNWNDGPADLRRAVELAIEARVDVLYLWATVWPFFGISRRFRRGEVMEDLRRMGLTEHAAKQVGPRVIRVAPRDAVLR